MGDTAIQPDLRERILREPDVILEDFDVMRALIGANDRQIGDNVVDLRGIAMERLEYRLDQLEDTHRTVIAAAYDNLAGTNMIHRAVLRLMEAEDFATFVTSLAGPVADTLGVDAVRLILETDGDRDTAQLGPLAYHLSIADEGFSADYTGTAPGGTPRRVTLRQIEGGKAHMHGEKAADLRSEVALLLDLGPTRQPALLVMAAKDPQQFAPGQGTDLLGFFAGIVERELRRWLA